MGDAWSALLSEPIARAIKNLRAAELNLQAELDRSDVLRRLQVDPSSECPTCLQKISIEARHRIESATQEIGEQQRAERQRELATIRRKLAALERQPVSTTLDVIRLRWDAVEEASVDLTSKRDELDELTKQLENVDEESLRQTKADFESAIRQIDALERGIANTRKAIETNKVDAESIQNRLDRLSGHDLAIERRRRALFSDLHRLFDEAVGLYREQLRNRVESDATSLFKALTTETDYKGLRINESYGLTIVHKDGEDIPVRSAGAEHVVALSLVGALQRNAPLRGPIVIDSPFGRLDRAHTQNIVSALPSMAKQVILLVYEDELPPKLTRDELKGRLRGEWQLERRTARHTELVHRKD
jgi:DNA sulfur modification protein DndD